MKAACGPYCRFSKGSEIRIAAQMYLERFYEGFGFRRVTEPYLEDEIWHVDMRRG